MQSTRNEDFFLTSVQTNRRRADCVKRGVKVEYTHFWMKKLVETHRRVIEYEARRRVDRHCAGIRARVRCLPSMELQRVKFWLPRYYNHVLVHQ